MRMRIFILLGLLCSFALYTCCDDDEDNCPELCDSSVPVVLDGTTIPEGRIDRNAFGCVVELYLDNLQISSSNCLNGIEEYNQTLEKLYLSSNLLSSIDFSPLSSCRKLEILNLSNNQLTHIDLSPLSNCENLWYLSLCNNLLDSIGLSPLSSCTELEELNISYNHIVSLDLQPLSELEFMRELYVHGMVADTNYLDSISCAQICQFVTEHPNCTVHHECDCGKK